MNALACSLFSVVMCVGAPAMATPDRVDAEALYRADRQSCMAHTDASARQTCLREAAAVQQERRKGSLPSAPDSAALERNALVRCQVHREPLERDLCERMVRGDGQVRGDVASGGMIREITVTVPADAPAGSVR